jgi:hypothetical protein
MHGVFLCFRCSLKASFLNSEERNLNIPKPLLHIEWYESIKLFFYSLLPKRAFYGL